MVEADGFRMGKDMAIHCLEEHLFCGLPQVWQDDVQSIELMEVAMAAYGRAGAAVACFFAVVTAFHCPRWQCMRGDTFRQDRDTGRDIVQDPVDPDPFGCRRIRGVRIVDDQDQALGARRNSGPLQGRRDVPAVAGIDGRDLAVICKCW